MQAAVLVSHPSQYGKELLQEHPVGPAIIHPGETATRLPSWSNLLEGGVRRALIVGVGIQILQQFSGINAVLYFTPQILMQSGAGDLLANIGITGESASIMASGVTCFLMLPCILVAMWLMDRSGRR
jgi:MFS family permease